MSHDHHTNSPSESKSEREILELRIDLKLAEAKEALRSANETELERIAREKYEPKYKRLLGLTSIAIAVLIISLLWEWLGLPERIKDEAGKIIDQKLVDPQLANTLDEALSKKAIPFIAAQVQPIETNVAALKANVNEQTTLFGAMALDVSNKQVQLSSEQTVIRNQIHPLFGEVASLQSSVDTAQKDAKKLQDEQRLTTLMNRGEVFDSDAIHELQTIAQGTNETAPLAQAMFNKIQRNLLIDRYASSWVTFVETSGDKEYTGPFTSDEFALSLSDTSGTSLDGLVNILSDNKLFVPRLVELAHQSKDMWTISRIGKKLKEITDVDFFPWNLQPLDEWWRDNSSNYTNWPLAGFNVGFNALATGKFDIALTNFESVIKIDPTADQSRAFAIVSAIEIGDILKAQQLNTNYALPGERWQRWANAKIMLATNGIQQATEEVVLLAKKYPTFSTWTTKDGGGNYFIRQIDWTLYSKLMQSTNSVGTK